MKLSDLPAHERQFEEELPPAVVDDGEASSVSGIRSSESEDR